MAHFDAFMSSYALDPLDSRRRRTTAKQVVYQGFTVTLNAHLRIPDSMIDPSTTQEQFREALNRHVFLWPTKKDCQKMLDTYSRREPDGTFAVFELDAYSLLASHYDRVKLAKYDSGSAPRFPKHCSYRKSPDLFLPIDHFMQVSSSIVPVKASEIKEVLVEHRIDHVSAHLRAIYVDEAMAVPARWRQIVKPLDDLRRKEEG
nr:hypothetical protein [Paenibacillus aestuarii]